ncbi:hypothetical protein RFI_38084, partial [Reticulomyxa filosa]
KKKIFFFFFFFFLLPLTSVLYVFFFKKITKLKRIPNQQVRTYAQELTGIGAQHSNAEMLQQCIRFELLKEIVMDCITEKCSVPLEIQERMEEKSAMDDRFPIAERMASLHALVAQFHNLDKHANMQEIRKACADIQLTPVRKNKEIPLGNITVLETQAPTRLLRIYFFSEEQATGDQNKQFFVRLRSSSIDSLKFITLSFILHYDNKIYSYKYVFPSSTFFFWSDEPSYALTFDPNTPGFYFKDFKVKAKTKYTAVVHDGKKQVEKGDAGENQNVIFFKKKRLIAAFLKKNELSDRNIFEHLLASCAHRPLDFVLSVRKDLEQQFKVEGEYVHVYYNSFLDNIQEIATVGYTVQPLHSKRKKKKNIYLYNLHSFLTEEMKRYPNIPVIVLTPMQLLAAVRVCSEQEDQGSLSIVRDMLLRHVLSYETTASMSLLSGLDQLCLVPCWNYLAEKRMPMMKYSNKDTKGEEKDKVAQRCMEILQTDMCVRQLPHRQVQRYGEVELIMFLNIRNDHALSQHVVMKDLFDKTALLPGPLQKEMWKRLFDIEYYWMVVFHALEYDVDKWRIFTDELMGCRVMSEDECQRLLLSVFCKDSFCKMVLSSPHFLQDFLKMMVSMKKVWREDGDIVNTISKLIPFDCLYNATMISLLLGFLWKNLANTPLCFRHKVFHLLSIPAFWTIPDHFHHEFLMELEQHARDIAIEGTFWTNDDLQLVERCLSQKSISAILFDRVFMRMIHWPTHRHPSAVDEHKDDEKKMEIVGPIAATAVDQLLMELDYLFKCNQWMNIAITYRKHIRALDGLVGQVAKHLRSLFEQAQKKTIAIVVCRRIADSDINQHLCSWHKALRSEVQCDAQAFDQTICAYRDFDTIVKLFSQVFTRYLIVQDISADLSQFKKDCENMRLESFHDFLDKRNKVFQQLKTYQKTMQTLKDLIESHAFSSLWNISKANYKDFPTLMTDHFKQNIENQKLRLRDINLFPADAWNRELKLLFPNKTQTQIKKWSAMLKEQMQKIDNWRNMMVVWREFEMAVRTIRDCHPYKEKIQNNKEWTDFVKMIDEREDNSNALISDLTKIYEECCKHFDKDLFGSSTEELRQCRKFMQMCNKNQANIRRLTDTHFMDNTSFEKIIEILSDNKEKRHQHLINALPMVRTCFQTHLWDKPFATATTLALSLLQMHKSKNLVEAWGHCCDEDLGDIVKRIKEAEKSVGERNKGILDRALENGKWAFVRHEDMPEDEKKEEVESKHVEVPPPPPHHHHHHRKHHERTRHTKCKPYETTHLELHIEEDVLTCEDVDHLIDRVLLIYVPEWFEKKKVIWKNTLERWENDRFQLRKQYVSLNYFCINEGSVLDRSTIQVHPVKHETVHRCCGLQIHCSVLATDRQSIQ